jgi:hypothetical protein
MKDKPMATLAQKIKSLSGQLEAAEKHFTMACASRQQDNVNALTALRDSCIKAFNEVREDVTALHNALQKFNERLSKAESQPVAIKFNSDILYMLEDFKQRIGILEDEKKPVASPQFMIPKGVVNADGKCTDVACKLRKNDVIGHVFGPGCRFWNESVRQAYLGRNVVMNDSWDPRWTSSGSDK